MLTVAEALAAILETVKRPAPVTVDLANALGLTLAEAIVSDIDSPPFTKALMDGYAVRSEDIAAGRRCLKIVEEITAGHVPTKTVGLGEASRIMTGAPMPSGADAVVIVEETALGHEPETVEIHAQSVAVEANLLPQGTAVRRGTQVLSAGRVLRAQEIAALAELGRPRIAVYPRPRVAILATGDELVSASQQPGPGQIRNSNEPMLTAQIRQAGGEPVPLGIARDRREELRERIEAGLACDLLLLSGGVSAGKLDLVPSELAAAGVRQVFHKIQMKPGKPLWFGVREFNGHSCHVFGLPGNPVSSMVCCEIFVRTALRKLLGIEPAEPRPLAARLEKDYAMRGNRPVHHPAHIEWRADGAVVRVVDWAGSSDVCATVDANGTIYFPPGEKTWRAGEVMEAYPW